MKQAVVFKIIATFAVMFVLICLSSLFNLNKVTALFSHSTDIISQLIISSSNIGTTLLTIDRKA